MLSVWLLAIGTALQVVTGSIVPPLFDYDSLAKCRQDHTAGAVFCYVKVITKADDPFRSASEDINSTRVVQQFRRNLLDHAICVQDCEREVAELSEKERERLYCEEFPVEFRHIYSTCHWKDQLEPFKKKYSKLINICVNNRLERRYNLTYHGYSKIEYCLDNQPGTETFDVLKLVFIATVSALLVTLLYSNLCDLFGIRRETLIVSSFSLRRTWANFTEESKSDLYKDFAYIDGLRVVVNFIILYGHCVIVPLNMPVDNPEDLEQYSMEVSSRYFSTMFAFPVQIFFTISGLLLMVNFLRDIKRKPKLEPGYFRSKIVNRLIRLLPVYYFFLLAATIGAILPGVELGLLGYTVLVRDQQICRSNWWTNVLMINNLPFYEDQCMMHSWYLGADLQLFLLGLLVLWMIWKFPRVAKVLFWGLMIISIVIPAVITYRNGIESIMTTKHSQTPFLCMYDKWVRDIYQPSYNNINSFIGGMIAGYLYHKIKHDKLNLSKSRLYNVIQKISTPLFALSILPINLFFTHNVPQWGILLHSILHRNMVVVMVCLGYISCFQSPKGWPRRFLSSRLMTTMGKLCYSSYVLHTLLIRYIVNSSPALLHFSAGDITVLILATVGLSYVASIPVYLTIEQPVSTLLKSLFSRDKKAKKA